MVELERRVSLCQWQEISLKKWAVGTRLSMNFSLREFGRATEDFKQSSEMLRSAFLKDPIPVWRKDWARARQTGSTVFVGPELQYSGVKMKGHRRDMKGAKVQALVTNGM